MTLFLIKSFFCRIEKKLLRLNFPAIFSVFEVAAVEEVLEVASVRLVVVGPELDVVELAAVRQGVVHRQV